MMGLEMESIWDSMKGPYYQKIMGELQSDIQSATELSDGLTCALNKVVQATHAEAGTCWFYDRFGDGRIRAKAACGGRSLDNFSLAPGEGVAGQVISDGKSIIIPDCQKDPRWAGKADKLTGFRTLSMICVPLTHKGNIFGCIQIINKTDGVPFDEKDLAFAEDLAAASTHLFERQHFLDDYSSKIDAVNAQAAKLSFDNVFLLPAFADVEAALSSSELFSSFSETDRKHILRLSREMWLIVQRNRPAQDTAKRGFLRK